MQTEDTKAVEEKKQGEHEDTFHSPWEFEPEEWKPITNTERRRILIASLFAFGLIWFGAIMTVSSLCIWWLPTRRYPISSLFEGTWWPAIITSTSAAICSLGVWLMILTYRHAESIGFGGEHEEKSQLAQEGSAEAAEQVGSMASATEEAPPAAITGPTLVGEDKYKIDSVCTYLKRTRINAPQAARDTHSGHAFFIQIRRRVTL